VTLVSAQAIRSARHRRLTIEPGDIAAGLSVALVVIPQGHAYAQLAGMPAHRGLHAAAVPPLDGGRTDASRLVIYLDGVRRLDHSGALPSATSWCSRAAGLRVSLDSVPAHARRIVAATLGDPGGLRLHGQQEAR
jgi:hypothetical protein